LTIYFQNNPLHQNNRAYGFGNKNGKQRTSTSLWHFCGKLIFKTYRCTQVVGMGRPNWCIKSLLLKNCFVMRFI